MGTAQALGFVLICWAPCAWGVRSDSNDLGALATEEKGTSSFITNAQTFCLGTVGAAISCKDFKGTIISVTTAFRNSAAVKTVHEAHEKEEGVFGKKKLFKTRGERCQLPKTVSPPEEFDCESEKVTDALLKCNGRITCPLGDMVEVQCSKFSMMRIVFDCVKGTEETADQDIERHELDGDSLPSKTTTSSVPAGKAKVTTSSSSTSTTEETFAEKTAEERAHDVVKKKREEEDIELEFNPCYRYTRWDKTWSSRWGIFEYLTSCPYQEGCFRLVWADKSLQYTDSEVPPSQSEIAQAELSRHDDSTGYIDYFFGTTWFSTGLQRNDYNTWGICLPKNEGVDEAVAFFKAMKKR